jgi:hypothetical protein
MHLVLVNLIVHTTTSTLSIFSSIHSTSVLRTTLQSSSLPVKSSPGSFRHAIVFQKGLRPGNFSFTHRVLSRCGLSRSFSSCQIRAARRIRTEEELALMLSYTRWYYRQMDDPVLRRKLPDGRLRNIKRFHAALRQKGGYEGYLEKKRAIEEVYRVDLQFRFARHM